jgi:hypothetical protein
VPSERLQTECRFEIGPGFLANIEGLEDQEGKSRHLFATRACIGEAEPD